MKNKQKKITSRLIAFLCICSIISGFWLHTQKVWGYSAVSIQNDLWMGADGNIYFQTYDLMGKTSISYKTIGFRVTRCALGTKNPIVNEYVEICLDNYEDDSETAGTYVTTVFSISAEDIMARISAVNPEWYADITSGENCYLKFDAIMITISNGIWSGAVLDNSPYVTRILNSASNKPAVYDIDSKDALKTAYSWRDPASIDSHFNKYLLFSGPGITSHVNHNTGKLEAHVKTGNYSTEFSLSDGIPTSETVINEIEADKWFGNAVFTQQEVTKKKTYYYELNYQIWDSTAGTWVEDETETDGGHMSGDYVDKKENYSVSVDYTIKYWYLGNLNVYTLDEIDVFNSTYGNDQILVYNGYDSVPITYVINGIGNPSRITDWSPIESQHVDWDEASNESAASPMSITASTLAECKKIADNDANSDTKVDIRARNDTLSIDGNLYMNGEWISLNSSNDWKTLDPTYFPSDGNYTKITGSKSIEIPSYVENNVYYTQLKYIYRRIAVQGTDYVGFANSIIPNNILDQWYANEPIKVHTPVISPVRVVGETKTQLVNAPEDNYVDGQFILDNYYTFHWDSAVHRAIMGYGDSGDPSKYDKYTIKKEMCFPVDVYYNGSYKRANSYFEIAKADWIDTLIYIPSWAEETTGTVKYRVTAENTLDDDGRPVAERIELQENTANISVKVDGSGKNYIATYETPIQTSGILYGFEVDGVNDKELFTGESVEITELQDYSLALNKKEKKVGTKNRLGMPSLRYTVDGLVTSSWDEENTLPMGVDKNGNATGIERGLRFSYQLRSIANLGDDSNDCIYIRPTYRYVDENGNTSTDIKLYYHTDSGLFVEYGSDSDINFTQSITLGDNMFEGSVYDYGEGYRTNNYHGNELSFTAGMDLTQGLTNYSVNEFLNRFSMNYNLSNIKMSNKLRVLSGNYGFLRMSSTGEGNLALNEYTDMENRTGYSYNILNGVGDSTSSGELYSKMVASMQTWHGVYEIPDQLYVTDSSINLEEYAINNELSENSDIWYDSGYLVLNFYIYSKNNGNNHLRYFASSDSNTSINMWNIEGAKKEMNINGNIVPLKPGDVAVIALSDTPYTPTKRSDKYTDGIFMIN